MNKQRSRQSTDSFQQGGVCTAVIGSMTLSMRAQAVLAEAAIRSNIAKISSHKAQGGCAYGVDFPCTQSANVHAILSRSGIRVKQYLEN